MTIDSIKDGVVIDHIKSGKAMDIYKFSSKIWCRNSAVSHHFDFL